MLKSENVATPSTTARVLARDSVPGRTRPPLCPIAIVTVPVKVVTGLADASVTVTCRGCIVVRGSVVAGCCVKTRCGGGLSVRALASQLPAALKYHVQRGSVGPPLGKTAYSPSAFIDASDMFVKFV